VAWGVPQDFWETATASLDSIKPVYMLAEDEDHPDFLKKAFESNYTWKLHHIMNDVAQGKKTAADIQKYYTDSVNKYAEGAFPMQFITNHDENSWAGSEYERMGEAVKTFAALTFTLEGIPLIYSGQEAGLKKRLLFFEKDTINWKNLEMQNFYQKLTGLKHSNQALWNGSAGGNMVFAKSSTPENVLAFTRTKANNQILAVFNLSANPLVTTVQIPEKGEYLDYFEGQTVSLDQSTQFKLDRWGYKIFIRK
jgi:glycosidase